MTNSSNWDQYTAKLVSNKGATGTNKELLEKYAQGRILDAGCGTGIQLGRLAQLTSVTEAYGVDLGKPGLDYGKKHFPNLKLSEGSLYELPFPDNYFDFVYSIDVVEHLDKPDLAIKEIFRVCKLEGKVFIQTPNYPVKRLYDFFHWLKGSKKSLADDPTHVYFFNFSELTKMVSKSGLKVMYLGARNLLLEKYITGLIPLKEKIIGHYLGQKLIIIAYK